MYVPVTLYFPAKAEEHKYLIVITIVPVLPLTSAAPPEDTMSKASTGLSANGG